MKRKNLLILLSLMVMGLCGCGAGKNQAQESTSITENTEVGDATSEEVDEEALKAAQQKEEAEKILAIIQEKDVPCTSVHFALSGHYKSMVQYEEDPSYIRNFEVTAACESIVSVDLENETVISFIHSQGVEVFNSEKTEYIYESYLDYNNEIPKYYYSSNLLAEDATWYYSEIPYGSYDMNGFITEKLLYTNTISDLTVSQENGNLTTLAGEYSTVQELPLIIYILNSSYEDVKNIPLSTTYTVDTQAGLPTQIHMTLTEDFHQGVNKTDVYSPAWIIKNISMDQMDVTIDQVNSCSIEIPEEIIKNAIYVESQ